MGALLAKFRKEKTTESLLEVLDEQIRQLEKYTLNTQEQKKRIVGNFLAVSIGVYVIAFIVFYFAYFPPTWKERIFHSVPLLLFPLVIILLRMLFTWYFQRKLNKNSNKLTALRAEKKKILEQVMDKETYKVAVKLLNRFGEKGNRYSFGMTPRVPSATSLNLSMRSNAAGGASNLLGTLNAPQLHAPSTSLPVGTPRQIPTTQRFAAGSAEVRTAGAGLGMPRQLALSPRVSVTAVASELRRRTPFPIVNQQEKGVFERIVDVLIGDGPQDRFAMICKQCYAHNGMALKEDFEYATFRCAFCGAMNHSRKARPVAPLLPVSSTPTHHSMKANNDSSSPSSSSSDDDSGRQTSIRRHFMPPRNVEMTETVATTATATAAGTVNSNAMTAAVDKPATETAAEFQAVRQEGGEKEKKHEVDEEFEQLLAQLSQEEEDEAEGDSGAEQKLSLTEQTIAATGAEEQEDTSHREQKNVNDEFKKEM